MGGFCMYVRAAGMQLGQANRHAARELAWRLGVRGEVTVKGKIPGNLHGSLNSLTSPICLDGEKRSPTTSLRMLNPDTILAKHVW